MFFFLKKNFILHTHIYKTRISFCLFYYLFYLNNNISLIFYHIKQTTLHMAPPTFFFSFSLNHLHLSCSPFPPSFFSLFFPLFLLKISQTWWLRLGQRWFCGFVVRRSQRKSKMKGEREKEHKLSERRSQWSPPQAPISSTSIDPLDPKMLISTTDPLLLTHKRYRCRRQRSISYMLVCLCGCVCVSLCWIVLVGVLLCNRGKRRWGRIKETWVRFKGRRERKKGAKLGN